MIEPIIYIEDLQGTVAGAVVAAWLRDLAANGDNSSPYDTMLTMAEYLTSTEDDDET